MKVKWSGKRTLVALAVVGGVLVLYVLGEDQRREQGRDGSEPTSSTSQCRVASTVDGLNVRSAPAIDPANVVETLAKGEETDADKVVENGFRKLGEGRWVSVEFVQPLEGRDC